MTGLIDRRGFVTGAAAGVGLAALPARAAPQPVVETSAGKLRGVARPGVVSFKGVRYGASTAGPNRFKAPLAVEPWTGILDAVALGPQAPQYPSPGPRRVIDPASFRAGAEDISVESEDCLVLNIWTPSLDLTAKRPVMVWLHGGGVRGSGGWRWYDGADLARSQNVVVVTLNHRLNLFGHLNLAEAGGADYADSANAGILDCVAALRWLRDHVVLFGGDAGNVTIFGQSGGGITVGSLLAMPAASGLFHRAIIQSGSFLRGIAREDSLAATDRILKELEITPERLAELRAMPVRRLLAAMVKAVPEQLGGSPLAPVVDGRTLPRHPFEPDATPVSAGVPVLLGTNATETSAAAQGPADFAMDEATLRARLAASLANPAAAIIESRWPSMAGEADALIAAYRSNRPDASPSDLYFAITTDQNMRVRCVTQAERLAARPAASTFLYQLNWRTPVQNGQLGSPHSLELPFVFNHVRLMENVAGRGPAQDRLAAQMSGAWAAFARTGNPNHGGLPDWPAYETGRRATMIFDTECRVEDDPNGVERRLWKA